MRKKLFTISLCILMVMSLSSCKKEEEKVPDSGSQACDIADEECSDEDGHDCEQVLFDVLGFHKKVMFLRGFKISLWVSSSENVRQRGYQGPAATVGCTDSCHPASADPVTRGR